jgi:hypothetical protein
MKPKGHPARLTFQETGRPRSGGLAEYKDFLTLWRDADPDIPILKQAKAEYAEQQ